jgi:hypothetical protein
VSPPKDGLDSGDRRRAPLPGRELDWRSTPHGGAGVLATLAAFSANAGASRVLRHAERPNERSKKHPRRQTPRVRAEERPTSARPKIAAPHNRRVMERPLEAQRLR